MNFKGGYSIKRMEDRSMVQIQGPDIGDFGPYRESIRLPVEALVQYVSKVAKKTKKARKR